MVGRIINSILDNDLYKFTMQYAVFKLFPWLKVRYKFTDRKNLSYPNGFDAKIREQIVMLSQLKLLPDEKNFLSTKLGKFLPPTYIDFLSGYQFDPSEVSVSLNKDNKLNITIQGYWYRTILWEVVLMAIISELYFIDSCQTVDIELNRDRDLIKLNYLKSHNSYFADFGTRRRYSFKNQERIVKLFSENGGHNFVGTSNVYLAYTYDLKCIGTHAHEWFMGHAALYGYKMANKMALENWVNVYRGDLGIALSDTYTTDVFFKSFNTQFSKLFDGVRHDSGNPFEFTDKVIKHYNSLGIDPMSKVIVFSDGLNYELANELKEYCVGKIKCSFGIGTHFTNDVGVDVMNMVIKLYQVYIDGHWVNCVKLSDNEGKHAGNEEEVELSKKILNL